jgi:hypothetical protein
LNHAKSRHKAVWNSSEAATVQENALENVRQQGRDEVRAELQPQLVEMPELIRRVEFCDTYHQEMLHIAPRQNPLP